MDSSCVRKVKINAVSILDRIETDCNELQDVLFGSKCMEDLDDEFSKKFDGLEEIFEELRELVDSDYKMGVVIDTIEEDRDSGMRFVYNNLLLVEESDEGGYEISRKLVSIDTGSVVKVLEEWWEIDEIFTHVTIKKEVK